MGRDLTNLYIDETFQYLLQKSGSEVQNGLGVPVDFLDISSSYATSASYAVTASYALNVPAFDTGSLLVTASISDATLTFTKGDASTFNLTVDNVANALNSSHAANTVITVKNLEATEIPKGAPLYITDSGTSGQLVGVYLADASNPSRMPAGAIAGETLAAGAEGLGYLDGFIQGVNTTGFTSGQAVYVGVGGGYQSTRPTGSNVLVQALGYIAKVSDSAGSGVIQGSGRANDIPNIQQGYVFVGGPGDVGITVSTGSLSVFHAVSASYAVSASHEIIKEISSSYADYAKEAGYATSSLNAATASYVLGSNVHGPVSDAVNAVSSSYSLTATSASHAISADTSISSSYALTASYAANAGTWDGQYSGSAGITGSLTVIGDFNAALTDGDLGSVASISKGISSYTLSINQFPGFTGSLISANNVDEFKISGDTSIALDNTGYAGTNQVAVRASDTVRLQSVNGVEVEGSTNIIGHNQNTLRLQTTGSSDYVEVSGPVSPPFSFDGNYIHGVGSFRDYSGFNYLTHPTNGGNTTLYASGSAATKVAANVNGAEVLRVVNEPGGDRGLQVTGNTINLQMSDTGSYGLFIDYYGSPTSRAQTIFNVGGYNSGTGWVTTSNLVFGQADQSFFSAEGDFYIKNILNDTGSITVWSENNLTLRGDTGVVITGDDPSTQSDPIDIYGKAFADTISTNINGFSYQVNSLATVRDYTRAFVETPLIIAPGGTVVVGVGSTLKVINEL